MSRPAILTVAARDDLRAELRWIGPDNLPKARALRDAVLVAAKRLGEHPMLGRLQPELLRPPYRFWSLSRFQMVLVYNAGVVSPLTGVLHNAAGFVSLKVRLISRCNGPGVNRPQWSRRCGQADVGQVV